MNTDSVSATVALLVAAEPDVAQRDEVAAIVRCSREVRSWLDSVDVACARRTRELASAGQAEPAESLLGDEGQRSSTDAVIITRRTSACDAMPAFESALAAGLIAFGAGWLVSSLLPASRREQELGDQAKQVAQEKVQPVLQQVAGEVGDNLREPAQQAAESVKATAQDAKETVADEGRWAAQDVSGRAQHAAGNVRSSTNGG